MDYYSIPYEDFPKHHPDWKFVRFGQIADLHRYVAREIVDLLKKNNAEGTLTKLILPVGPLDYKTVAELCNKEGVSCKNLVTFNMDEYIDEKGKLISRDHPLSFRSFMDASFFSLLDDDKKMLPEHIHFPDPDKIDAFDAIIESYGAADITYAGFGLTGHVAFNDPPEPGEPDDAESFRSSPTRIITIGRESQAQMAMGATDGNLEILPRQAVTIGMKSMLASKAFHLTFMRRWHSGVLRRALFGPVTVRCPGSFVQEHPNVKMYITDIAAEPPSVTVRQAIGKKN